LDRIRTSLTAFSPRFACVLALALAIPAICHQASAAPVFGKKMTLRQPDGQLVEVRIWGDEFYQVVESLDGYALTRHPASNAICYARVSDDKRQLVSTGVRLGAGNPHALGLTKHERISPQAVSNQVAAAKAAYTPGAAKGRLRVAADGQPIPATTSTGNILGVCLIVDFSDDVGTISPSMVSSFCNDVGFTGFGNNGSVRDYFNEVSEGHLISVNHVPQQYYRASRPKTYYDDPAATYGTRARELVVEALNALEASGFDFSQHDADHDGKIDAINCYYAGTTTSGWASGLWPHSSTLTFSADGVTGFRYQISYMGNQLKLDTFCHENGHMLCNWPDLYDYDFDSYGVGRYCLMCDSASETNPVQPCAYLKYLAGWAETTLLITGQVGLPLPAGENRLYKLEHPTKTNEYFLVENRQQTGRDQALPDSGLALWHIDTEGSNDFQQRTSLYHYEATLVQADGRWDLESTYGNSGDSTDLWKSPAYTTCGPETLPNTSWWDGSYSSLGLSQISNSGPMMTFTFGSSALVVTPKNIRHVLYPGSTLPNDTFTLSNPSTIVPLDYTVNRQSQYLVSNILPASGTLLGDSQTITIVYDNASLPYWPPGTYGNIFIVRAPGAQNDPQYVMLEVIIGSIPGDLDHDSDVDQADFGLLQGCMSGTGVAQTRPECAEMSLDHDSDVDQSDLQVLLRCLSGPDTAAELDCDQ
jgi:M6 family metalloprotease-like protein